MYLPLQQVTDKNYDDELSTSIHGFVLGPVKHHNTGVALNKAHGRSQQIMGTITFGSRLLAFHHLIWSPKNGIMCTRCQQLRYFVGASNPPSDLLTTLFCWCFLSSKYFFTINHHSHTKNHFPFIRSPSFPAPFSISGDYDQSVSMLEENPNVHKALNLLAYLEGLGLKKGIYHLQTLLQTMNCFDVLNCFSYWQGGLIIQDSRIVHSDSLAIFT